MNHKDLHYEMVSYLYESGWTREEKGSGWFWKEGSTETTLGHAVQDQLEEDGIDTREEPVGLLTPSYWG